jgi:hypothetical protein
MRHKNKHQISQKPNIKMRCLVGILSLVFSVVVITASKQCITLVLGISERNVLQQLASSKICCILFAVI